jgi:superfamily II DNA or RNA helicase
MVIKFPNVYLVNELRAKNRVLQIGERSLSLKGRIADFSNGSLRGHVFYPDKDSDRVLIIPKTTQRVNGFDKIIQGTLSVEGEVANLLNGAWLKHPLLHRPSEAADREQEIRRVLESWVGAFRYLKEDLDRGALGLRNPQIGAIHAVHAHWSVSDSPATIVMPTGTGKTETMLSILVSARCPKLLVVVPTDSLRTQLAEKYATLGILGAPECAVLLPNAQYPIVCTLRHIPRTTREVNDVFACSQVIVTTSSIASQCDLEVQEQMASHCPYLFIDEAHHVEAPTLREFKERFSNSKILQFTATPFREDGKPLDGIIIFKYPLGKAQQEGYFAPIRFEPVVEFNKKRADAAIARKAIELLRAEADKGHILMARVETVARAKEVYELYAKYSEFMPVQLHTGITSQRQRDATRQQIIAGKSRIVVCVDMLGEGFDLPELKIAAFHDIRKTLAVTLQLAGRFTRARPDLGQATFIANTADVDVREELRKLYTRDPDWNILLPQLSDRMIGEQLSLQEFLKGFTEFNKEIPLRTVRPATSTVVYRTTVATWRPENFRAGIPGLSACEQVYDTVNYGEHTLVVVTARRVPLLWTDVESLFSWEWELYVVIWSPEQNLLYINSSTNSGDFERLARAVTDDSATLVDGQQVFRAFSGVHRLRLQNVGLTEQLGRNVRYTGRMGADIEPALPDVQRRHARKSVLAGSGYENGEKATIGASRRGRIWSHRRERVDQLAAWCKQIGAKLLDSEIDPDEVLKGTLEPRRILQRPEKMPVSIDWPEEIYITPEAMWSLKIGERELALSEVSLEIISGSLEGPLQFAIVSEKERAELQLELFESEEVPSYRFSVSKGTRVLVCRQHAEPENVTEFFDKFAPVFWFSDGSQLEGNQYVELKSTHPAYDAAKIEAWDWTGIDIRKESQGALKDSNSIQARVIQRLRLRGYQLIVDDDGKGEAADVVAIRLVGGTTVPSGINVEFYHCKYSQEATPGQRIKDLYEVCGQAQKSVQWMSSPEKRTDLFMHLLRREARQQQLGALSRYEIGDGELLITICEVSRLCPVSLKVYIVQPGLSKANATREQLELISVTESYLMETYQIGFGVIASG